MPVAVAVEGSPLSTISVDDFEEDNLIDDRTKQEIEKAEEDIDLYNIKNFSI
jgi:hypothetical protein